MADAAEVLVQMDASPIRGTAVCKDLSKWLRSLGLHARKTCEVKPTKLDEGALRMTRPNESFAHQRAGKAGKVSKCDGEWHLISLCWLILRNHSCIGSFQIG